MTTLVGSISNQSRIFYACAQRIIRLRTLESPLGILSSLIEPLALILMMTLIFSSVRMRVPGLGDYLLLFFMTGIITISVFKQGDLQAEQAFTRMRKMLVLPHLRPIDFFVSGVFTLMMVMVVLFFAITVFFHTIYDTPWPQNMMLCMVPLLGNACIALGFASLNSLIKTWFKFWAVIWGTLTMPISIMSGMFYTAETLPQVVRDVLWWNPILHSTELMRTYYFTEFNSDFFSASYYASWVFGSLFVGLLVERVFRYRLSTRREIA